MSHFYSSWALVQVTQHNNKTTVKTYRQRPSQEQREKHEIKTIQCFARTRNITLFLKLIYMKEDKLYHRMGNHISEISEGTKCFFCLRETFDGFWLAFFSLSLLYATTVVGNSLVVFHCCEQLPRTREKQNSLFLNRSIVVKGGCNHKTFIYTLQINLYYIFLSFI